MVATVMAVMASAACGYVGYVSGGQAQVQELREKQYFHGMLIYAGRECKPC